MAKPHLDEAAVQRVMKPDSTLNKWSFARCEKWQRDPRQRPNPQVAPNMTAIWNKGLRAWKYKALVSFNSKSWYLGVFNTAEEAAHVASAAKWRRDQEYETLLAPERKRKLDQALQEAADKRDAAYARRQAKAGTTKLKGARKLPERSVRIDFPELEPAEVRIIDNPEEST